ncbi:hypothetical protein WA026_001914 [Henosepilachna vigintioctopunctata]|uniref:Uncharacterized protein n=1 Tax=Henosepilachna vigintioctopunctata TaxID=420089 RepID=A0AAW1UV60_9CUCU
MKTDNSQKQKDFYNKEQDVSRNKEAKRNTVHSKEKSLNRTTEDKTSLLKKTVSNKDTPKSKDKPTQKVTNYASKKTASTHNIRGEISKQTQDKNLKIDAKKTQQPDVKLNGDREVKEVHKKEYLRETYEGRTPVEEPLVIKKSVSLLYSDEEDDKKSTQMLIESEIIDQNP